MSFFSQRDHCCDRCKTRFHCIGKCNHYGKERVCDVCRERIRSIHVPARLHHGDLGMNFDSPSLGGSRNGRRSMIKHVPEVFDFICEKCDVPAFKRLADFETHMHQFHPGTWMRVVNH